MENILLYLILIVFGMASGFAIGAGNRKGVGGAIIPGMITGLIVAIPAIRESELLIAAMVSLSAVAGSIISALTADDMAVKHMLRSQSLLVISCGSFQLGKTEKNDSDDEQKD